MSDYAELVKALRMCGGDIGACRRCPRYGTDDCHSVFGEAADAIEELLEEKRLLESNNALQAQIIQHMKTIMRANGLSVSPKGGKK